MFVMTKKRKYIYTLLSNVNSYIYLKSINSRSKKIYKMKLSHIGALNSFKIAYLSKFCAVIKLYIYLEILKFE